MDYQTQQILLQELVVLREGITKTLETLYEFYTYSRE